MPLELQTRISNAFDLSSGRPYSDPCEIISNCISDHNPRKLEGKWNVHDRVSTVKLMIKDYIRKNSIPDEEKIVLVTHFVY
mmetsp:Transcript_12937/g.12924  ORF Transcript_12937/g.12924 Transcript_12937/m.12924 type:complete len:81 (+) Transcript_12937:83-325(+)